MIKLTSGQMIPLEMHRANVVSKISLPGIKQRQKAIREAGNNTFLLKNTDIFLDMLTDSGVNAMSNNQVASMMQAEDSYAGSATFYRLENALKEIFQKEYFLPAHQGRACEHLLGATFVKDGYVVPMNYHFTTAKAHITIKGGSILEIPIDEAFKVTSDHPFKGNMDLGKLNKAIADHPGKIAFVRMEAGTNLIGGQPFSLENFLAVSKICRSNKITLVLDASLLMDNLYFCKIRESQCANMEVIDICRAFAEASDIIYFSARKLGFARGGGICLNDKALFLKIRGMVPLFEGFLTYGGMSVREMEAIAVGLKETMDMDIISQGPQFIEFMVNELVKRGIPVVTPAGGLGCHIDARSFLPHVKDSQYPAGALAAALYLVSGVRCMERGTLSEQRNPDGTEPIADLELIRLALPRRLYTMSHILYTVDRLEWLFKNRKMVEGLKWIEEPEILRFFFGRLDPVSNWQDKLTEKFIAEVGEV